MRRLIFIAFLISFVFEKGLTIPTVQAQTYPNRSIQLIMPQVAGSAGDVAGRLFAEELGKILSTPVIVVNKPGAAQVLGTDFVVRSKKDGYTITYSATSGIIYARVSNPETVPYDPVKDLEPLGLHCFFPLTITVVESSPWKTFGELIDDAKKNPGKIRFCTQGQGTIDHFNLEIMQALTGAQFTHVPFKGGQLIATLLGGHAEVTSNALSLAIPHVKAGNIRMLLITKKVPEFPNVPTITELGYKQDLLSPWFALYAPIGMPEEVKKVLVPAVEKAIKSPELKAKMEKLGGYLVDYKSPAELKKLMGEDYEKALAVAIKAGLRK
jgi:tripartite-type tricarboxylate transporter receptor subunit TctC